MESFWESYSLGYSVSYTHLSLRASDDAMNSLIALAYQNTLLKRDYTSEDIIACIRKVTRADVIEVFSRCELKQTLIVTKEDDANDEEGK